MAIALHATPRLGAEAHEAVDKHLKSLEKMLSEATEKDVDEVIHDTRTGMKRMRAFLRLIRPAIGKSAYRVANAHSQRLARALSGNRDARMLLETVDLLLPAIENRDCRARLRQPFAAHYHEAFSERGGLQPLQHARISLHRLQQRVRHWHLKGYDQRRLKDAIAAEYAAGRMHWRQIRGHPQAEALHEWRKEVKRFYYQVSLLFPDSHKAQRTRLKDLGEYLGQLHDLHVLQDYVVNRHIDFWADDLVQLAHAAQQRELVLMEKIWRLAPKAYAEPAPSYSRKLIRRWRDLSQKKR